MYQPKQKPPHPVTPERRHTLNASTHLDHHPSLPSMRKTSRLHSSAIAKDSSPENSSVPTNNSFNFGGTVECDGTDYATGWFDFTCVGVDPKTNWVDHLSRAFESMRYALVFDNLKGDWIEPISGFSPNPMDCLTGLATPDGRPTQKMARVHGILKGEKDHD